VQVTPGYADRMKQRIDGLVGQREAVTATLILQDIIKRHKFRHDGSQILREHFSNTQISKRQGGWVMTAPMGVKGIYAARALMFAVAQATKAPAPVAMIYTRKRRHA
jgi:phage terminase large subunit-like protein